MVMVVESQKDASREEKKWMQCKAETGKSLCSETSEAVALRSTFKFIWVRRKTPIWYACEKWLETAIFKFNLLCSCLKKENLVKMQQHPFKQCRAIYCAVQMVNAIRTFFSTFLFLPRSLSLRWEKEKKINASKLIRLRSFDWNQNPINSAANTWPRFHHCIAHETKSAWNGECIPYKSK